MILHGPLLVSHLLGSIVRIHGFLEFTQEWTGTWIGSKKIRIELRIYSKSLIKCSVCALNCQGVSVLCEKPYKIIQIPMQDCILKLIFRNFSQRNNCYFTSATSQNKSETSCPEFSNLTR